MIFESTFKPRDIPEDKAVYETVIEGMKKQEPTKPALIDFDSGFTITYGELEAYIKIISATLRTRFEMKKGDTLAIILPNHPFYPALFHGVGMAGGIATTMNPLYKADEMKKQLNDSKAKYIVTIPLFMEEVRKAVEGTKVTKIFLLTKEEMKEENIEGVSMHNFMELLAKSDKMEELPKIEINPKDDLVCLPYSSGTTGLSKGVMLTHYNLVANLYQVDAVEPFGETDVLVGILPFFHIFGMIVVLNKALMAGGTIITFPKFDFVKFLTAVQKYKITHVHLVPPIVNALVNNAAVLKKFDLSSLKSLLSGAAPLAGTLAAACEAVVGCPVRIGYGLTESSPVISACPPGDNVHGSCGKLVPNAQLKIVDPETKEEKNRNEVGEIVFKGPNVFKGYLEQEEATKRTIMDGWLFTGDIGYVDDKDNIFISDRLKELIKRSGYQVEPAYLEGILLTHEAVSDAAVIGVPDDKAGEVPKAFVVAKDVTEDDIKNYVAEKVVYYKKIEYVEFVDAIPKSRSGKILRRILRDQEAKKTHSRNQES